MSEFDLIQKIKNTLPSPSAGLLTGIGDDAAVIQTEGRQILFCSDMMVEGVHFDLSYMTAADVGFKAVASCLSDIAAMNGRPLSVVISIAAPAEKAAVFIESFYQGVRDLQTVLKSQPSADEVPISFDVAGGDLSQSPSAIFIDVAALGETEMPLLRSGAKPGDLLLISGQPGLSAEGLRLLRKNSRGAMTCETGADLRAKRKHLRPIPRFDLLPALRRSKPSSLIDLSDGVASECLHIARQSQVSIVINSKDLVLDAGEDYELLATAKGPAPEGFRVIGFVEAGPPGLWFDELGQQRRPLSARGFDHFP